MNQQYDNTNSGVLFKNDKEGNDKRPDYTGKINVDGKDLRLAAWIRDGQKGKFMSLKVSEESGGQSSGGASGAQSASPADNDFDDDIPF